MKRRALYVLIVVSLVGSTAAPVWTRSDNEGVAGLPADVTPMLTLAGIWQGVTDEHVTPVNHGGISNFYSANLRLHNGREGIVIGSWSFAGFANTTRRSCRCRSRSSNNRAMTRCSWPHHATSQTL